MTEPWNCWPGGHCLTTAQNIAVAFGIGAVCLLLGVLIAWLIWGGRNQ